MSHTHTRDGFKLYCAYSAVNRFLCSRVAGACSLFHCFLQKGINGATSQVPFNVLSPRINDIYGMFTYLK